jgi:hypothetical protein
MYLKIVLFILGGVLLFTFCDSPTNSTVGSSTDVIIENVSFKVDTTYLESSSLYAKGQVTNLGNTTIQSPWFIEVQFYTDSTYKLKLGGAYTKIGVPLKSNQSTFWTLNFSTNNVDVNKYPNFRVNDLRAIHKNY